MKLFDFSKQEWTDLTREAVSYPTWSRDGKYIYCEGRGALYRVEVSNKRVERVASTEDLQRSLGIVGQLSLAPDGSPVLVHDVSVQEIYALDLDLP